MKYLWEQNVSLQVLIWTYLARLHHSTEKDYDLPTMFIEVCQEMIWHQLQFLATSERQQSKTQKCVNMDLDMDKHHHKVTFPGTG